MKKLILNILAVGAACLAVSAQGGVSIGFSGDGGITFTPGGGNAGSFTFTPGPDLTGGYQWMSNGGGQYVGQFVGNGPGGSFLYNNIVSGPGDEQSASIINGGTLMINDGYGSALAKVATGNINWTTISTGQGYAGNIGGAQLSLNVQFTSYTGTDQTLKYMVEGGAYVTVTFQFAPGSTLTDLATSGGQATTYNGSIYTPVPETSTTVAGFAAAGLVVLLLGAQLRRAKA